MDYDRRTQVQLKLCGITEKVLKVVAQFSFHSSGGKCLAWKKKTLNISGIIPPVVFKLSSHVEKIMGYLKNYCDDLKVPQFCLYVACVFHQY